MCRFDMHVTHKSKLLTFSVPQGPQYFPVHQSKYTESSGKFEVWWVRVTFFLGFESERQVVVCILSILKSFEVFNKAKLCEDGAECVTSTHGITMLNSEQTLISLNQPTTRLASQSISAMMLQSIDQDHDLIRTDNLIMQRWWMLMFRIRKCTSRNVR